MRGERAIFGVAAVVMIGLSGARAAEPDRALVRDALLKAVTSMSENYGRQGGYVWVYSPDGMIRAGEGNAGAEAAWVQPPGTPTVGESFLDAWEATGEERCLRFARASAHALVKGQLHSGGWSYRLEFEAEARKSYNYRVEGGSGPKPNGPAGWETWRKRKNRGNRSMLDDDTTQAALRFLMRIDHALEGKDEEIHRAVEFGLEALQGTQYPVGAWSHNFDSFPVRPPSSDDYPVMAASYPAEWPRTWPNAWDGCYHLNDNITTDCISTLLLAHELYGTVEALESAKRGGEFLIRAQMPDPQPAWCQQYDKKMQPVWERKFEPPAVTGGESQGVMEVLLDLYALTREERFLEPIPKALAYLKRSETSPGNLARYYELKTNQPLYFTKDYKLTDDASDVPTHYSFTVASRLGKIERNYALHRAGKTPKAGGPPSAERITELLESVNRKGVWLAPGFVRDEAGRKVAPKEGVLSSATFAKNVRELSAWLKAQHSTS